MTSLNLSGNRLAAWPSTSNVERRGMEYCQMNSYKSILFVQEKEDVVLQKLEYLNLLGNKFKEWPDIIWELSNLEYLSLSKNKFEKLPDSMVKLRENLKYLNLIQNPTFLHYSNMAGFWGMVDLRQHFGNKVRTREMLTAEEIYAAL